MLERSAAEFHTHIISKSEEMDKKYVRNVAQVYRKHHQYKLITLGLPKFPKKKLVVYVLLQAKLVQLEKKLSWSTLHNYLVRLKSNR